MTRWIMAPPFLQIHWPLPPQDGPTALPEMVPLGVGLVMMTVLPSKTLPVTCRSDTDSCTRRPAMATLRTEMRRPSKTKTPTSEESPVVVKPGKRATHIAGPPMLKMVFPEAKLQSD